MGYCAENERHGGRSKWLGQDQEFSSVLDTEQILENLARKQSLLRNYIPHLFPGSKWKGEK